MKGGVMSFFTQGAVADNFYSYLREGLKLPERKGRAYIEDLWDRFSSYVDVDANQKAKADLISVFWELHLAHALQDAGKELATRKSLRYRDNKGPDLRTLDPNVWIECVAARSGAGPDAPKRQQLGTVGSYDPDPAVLRLRSVIEDKSRKISEYMKCGVVKPEDAVVIAISGIALPFRFSGRFPPEIVRAVYPANNPVLLINRQTGQTADSYLEHRDTISKLSGATVGTDIFLRSEYRHISAVLFGESDWINRPPTVGAGFVLVHNKEASTPLPSGWFPRGHEYWWREESRLESKIHH